MNLTASNGELFEEVLEKIKETIREADRGEVALNTIHINFQQSINDQIREGITDRFVGMDWDSCRWQTNKHLILSQ